MYHDTLVKARFTNSLRGSVSHFAWRYVRNPRRTWHARRDADVARLASSSTSRDLHRNGIVIGIADQFLTDDGVEALRVSTSQIIDHMKTDAVQEVVQAGRNGVNNKDYLVHLVPAATVHDDASALLRLALDPKLLGIVADYFGMWPKLHSIGSWLNFPIPGDAKMSQLWHRDPADRKLLKVFIYLEDVSDDNGPFSFIPETQPFGAISDVVPAHEHKRRITDDEMDRAIPRDKWVSCTGPARTMVLADTVGFHRGGKVDHGHRLLITFTYTSGTPREGRELHVAHVPSWATLPIQRAALKGVV